MRTCCLGLLALLAAADVGVPASAGSSSDDYYRAVTEATREVSRQLDFLQRSFATIPGPPEGRGLVQQAGGVSLDLTFFQMQLGNKVSRDDLYIAFDKVDRKLQALLGDLEFLEKWNPVLRMAARRALAADHDLHFALYSGDGTPERQSQVVYRQTLGLLSRAEDMESMARFVLNDPDARQRWTSDLGDVRRALVVFQKLQQNKAARPELTKQFTATDQTWEKLVPKFKELRGDQYFLMQSDAVQVDQVLARLAQRFGIKDRRAPLPVNFFQ